MKCSWLAYVKLGKIDESSRRADSAVSFDARNLIYHPTRVHRLVRALSYLEVINIDGSRTSAQHRKLNLTLIKMGLYFLNCYAD